MEQGPQTYRDHLLSIYQSAAAEVARRAAHPTRADPPARAGAAGLARSGPVDIEAAAAEVAGRRFRAAGFPHPPERAAALGPAARSCAELGLRYLDAKLAGDAAAIGRIAGEFKAGTCDPAWVTTLDEYLRFFGPGGRRNDIPYIRPAAAGEGVIEIKPGAKVALVSDWGTGAQPAERVLRQVAALSPDLLVHLGDIYYSGTPAECDANFVKPIDAVLGASRRRLPVYALAGNHDMYCGGVGYYALIDRLNPGDLRQPASFFCLRCSDAGWQLLAMDTGLHDYSPLVVRDALTFLEPDELDWHRRRIAEFPGKTILLSHHQLFSAFSPIGPADAAGRRSPVNGLLASAFASLRAAGPIEAWFWGHEHSLGVYGPFADLARGRCIGHGAVPVFATEDVYAPVEGLSETPPILPGTQLERLGAVWAHGFAFLELGKSGESTRADYYQDLGGRAALVHSETIG